AVPKLVFTAALCEVPPVAVMLAGAPPVLVRLKLAGVATPDTVARSEERRVGKVCRNLWAVDTPMQIVVAVVVVNPPVNVPLAPLVCVVNVTVSPLIRLLLLSFVVVASAVPKLVFTAALCEVPPVAVMLAGAPPVLVRLKLAGVATPDTVA